MTAPEYKYVLRAARAIYVRLRPELAETGLIVADDAIADLDAELSWLAGHPDEGEYWQRSVQQVPETFSGAGA